jgi:predicted ATP-binding protein involved in virulence
MRIIGFSIYGLYGIFDHDVELKLEERVTIIHGPNGYGKTTLLRLVHTVCAGNLTEVSRTPFQTFVIRFDDGRRLEIKRSLTTGTGQSCQLRLMRGKKTIESGKVSTDSSNGNHEEIKRRFPFLALIGEDTWEDTNDGEILTTDDILNRFPINSSQPKLEKPEWFVNLVQPLNVKIIETGRLIRPTDFGQTGRRRRHSGPTVPLSVKGYASDLSHRIRATLADYAEKSQRLDQTFPIRLLDKSRTPSEELSGDKITNRIEELEKKRVRLKDAGLLERDEHQAKLPEVIDNSLQSVLAMYVHDVEEKLTGFEDILRKIEVLQQILNAHFSYKRLKISRDEGFAIYTYNGEPLDVSRLSSGEQHLLVLLYELLFTDRPNSLILIDEPEISLHVEWQIAFLGDLQQIAQIASHDVVIATHSPQIVNDRSDLMVPFLGPRNV